MTRRRAARVVAAVVAAGLAITLIVSVALVVTVVRRPLPDRGGEVTLQGLAGSVEVLRDERGVPHVYADTPEDLFRVQGYVHAQDRFFEMDLRRHVTAGRLSELVGEDPDALQADTVVRTLGWRRVAAAELPLLSADTRAYLQSYADGVNDYLRDRSPSELSVSYSVLARAHPLGGIEPWTPLDSLTWLKAVAWDLRSNYDDELGRAKALTTVRDVARIDRLYPAYPAALNPPILTGGRAPAGGDATGGDGSGGGSGGDGSTSAAGYLTELGAARAQRALAAAERAVAAMPDLLGAGDGIGSNSWVVSGPHTESGLPLLANDPHLAVSAPGAFHQTGLHCRQVGPDCPFDVSGFGFAGLPGVVVGHNSRIAWGLSTMYADTTDFFLERVEGDQVEVAGTLRPLEVREETIRVAGAEPVTIRVRSSGHGPLLSDALDEVSRIGRTAPAPGDAGPRERAYGVALGWTALTPGRAMDALFGINTAGDFASFRAAALLLDVPPQNLVYADVDGHIGYQAPGRIPVRGAGRAGAPVPADGRWPRPGWDPVYDWQGFLPAAQLPFVEDPAEGFLVAANQAVTAPGGVGARISADYDYGYRAARIRDVLTSRIEEGRPVTVADMQNIQRDTRNGIAAELLPLLLEADTDAFTDEAVQLLRGWDLTQPTDSAAAAYFNVVWVTLLDLTFSDELPEGARPDGGDRWFEVVRTLLAQPRDPWWDDLRTPNVVESRDEILRLALVQARLQLTARLGKDPERWQWGRLHRVRPQQTPLGLPGAPRPVRWLVNLGPFDSPGGSSIVNAFSWDAAGGTFDVVAAPAMRMVVDLDDLDRSRWVNQTGVSGHPWDDHYDDQARGWLRGEDFAWPFGRQAVEAAAGDRQSFRPAAG